MSAGALWGSCDKSEKAKAIEDAMRHFKMI